MTSASNERRTFRTMRIGAFFTAFFTFAALGLFWTAPSWGAIGIDANVSRDQGPARNTVSAPAFSTTSANQLLLAFISADSVSSPNIIVTQVAGAGLAWTLVRRTNVQLGTAEIWRAFAPSILSGVTVTATLSQSVASSITVMSFTGVDTSVADGSSAIGATGTGNANPGAPTASLTATRNGSWVLGVGNDWDNPIARTLGAGQSLIHRYSPPVGDTYWVQRQNSPTVINGTTTVTINDTAPTGDRYNLSIVEVLPATGSPAPTFSISGAISTAASGAGTTLTLTQGATTVGTAVADGSGNYSFANLPNGTYTVTPSKAGFTFNPINQTVTINGANATGVNFTATATPVVWSISGAISTAANGAGATLALTLGGTAVGTVVADSSGNYSFPNLANGTYTVTPSKTGFTFNPVNRIVTINGANATGINFTATAVTWSISGAISTAANGGGTTLSLTQGATTLGTATADGSGNYSFPNLANGTYTVTPSKTGFTFNPVNRIVTINGANATGINFMATAVTWSISGAITPAANGAGTAVTVTLAGTPIGTAVADGAGNYTLPNLANGTYTVIPTKTGFTFSPTNRIVTITGANATGVNFTVQGVSSSLLYPDLQVIVPPGKMSVAQTPTGREFRYTHDTFNAGPGPLAIQPALNAASGSYQGTQLIYSLDSPGNWSVNRTIPVAGDFFFHAVHFHFHFPLTSFGLYAVAPDGGPGAPVAISEKNGFCIANSFIYDPTIPNAGVRFGNLGSCSDPTSPRGLDIGAVDEYDQTDPGQSISLNGVPDGNYWFRAIADPNNFLAEADKTNNETDVLISIIGNTVQEITRVVPVLSAPPSIDLTAPANGATLSGPVQLTATTATTSGVQFLIDGQPFGSLVTAAPYSVSLDTTAFPNGSHWLSAQTKDLTGVIGTSAVIQVTVSNIASARPIVQLTSPTAGAILSSTVTLSATVASNQPIANVIFYVDDNPIGAPVTAPPYIISWATITATDGLHMIKALSTDSFGVVDSSPTVTVNVNNSHPPNLIGKDITVTIDGQGTMTTPLFSTATSGDLLLAFVAQDGPPNAPQTASVSSAGGLTWTLLIRSNTQLGTAEIWSARAIGTLSNVSVTSVPGSGGYHGSLTVIAFKNAAGTSVVGRSGAPTGAPDISIPGVIAGDWVFAVGNDWNNAIARTPVSGQLLVSQRVDTQVNDTFWVQSTAAPSAANGLVDIHDNAPTGDQWNYAAVEIVATHQ